MVISRKQLSLIVSIVYFQFITKKKIFFIFVLILISVFFSDPISNINVKGGQWLNKGQMLNLDIECEGTPPFSFCVNNIAGPYNITGNETCTSWDQKSECTFNFLHYFNSNRNRNYSLLLFLRNNVDQRISQIGIHIYECE